MKENLRHYSTHKALYGILKGIVPILIAQEIFRFCKNKI